MIGYRAISNLNGGITCPPCKEFCADCDSSGIGGTEKCLTA